MIGAVATMLAIGPCLPRKIVIGPPALTEVIHFVARVEHLSATKVIEF